ncbi:MAG: hypothetical protein AAFY65_13020 [Pseudomonadota bacterium]
MPAIQIFKETALPGTLQANAIYLVTDPNNASFLSMYVVNSAGTATRRTPTQADIQALAGGGGGGIRRFIVADIAARDALAPADTDSVVVRDASADATVASGAAEYVWDNENTAWIKTSEVEALTENLVFNWADITGGPTADPAFIDQAAASRHNHANKTQLDLIGEDGDQVFTYRGESYVQSGSTNW